MLQNTRLDALEQDIEDNFESLQEVCDIASQMHLMQRAAKAHRVRKRSITLRIHETDLDVMRVKSSKLGIPYQTYINILIHRDAISESV